MVNGINVWTVEDTQTVNAIMLKVLQHNEIA